MKSYKVYFHLSQPDEGCADIGELEVEAESEDETIDKVLQTSEEGDEIDIHEVEEDEVIANMMSP